MPDLLSAVVGKGIQELIVGLISEYGKRAVSASTAQLTKVRTNLTPHLESTFERCNIVKTLLNPQAPTTLLSIYATQRFRYQNRPLDHYGLIERIQTDSSNIMITGTGGGGKSMFTRYLWLSLFVCGDGRIPLFIELRSLNSFDTGNLLSYIVQSMSLGRSSVRESDFERMLSDGDFILLLDGFDEVSEERKPSVQEQILSLTNVYPKTRAIVTSRPHPALESWPNFYVADLMPMTKEDAVELIERSQFDEDPKLRFLKRLRSESLFEQHHTFLSNPLLASMMLLTFSHNFDIPERMHLFYQQAFEALYQRHDSHKPGGFTREFHTKITEDVFKRILAYFCLITYNRQQFQFDREGALDAIRAAAKIEGTKLEPSDFLTDLCDCVCFLVVEGTNYAFAHRSFQEYFAAYCLAYVSAQRFDTLIANFARRPTDQVVIMLNDMNPEVFRRQYLLPLGEQFDAALQSSKQRRSTTVFYEGLGSYFQIRMAEPPPGLARPSQGIPKRPKLVANIVLMPPSELGQFVTLLRRLAKPELVDSVQLAERRERDQKAALEIFSALNAPLEATIVVFGTKTGFEFAISTDVDVEPRRWRSKAIKSAAAEASFRRSFMFEWIGMSQKTAADFVRDQRKIEDESGGSLEQILGIAGAEAIAHSKRIGL